MIQSNLDIREMAQNSGVYLWQIALRLGMHDSNFSRLLRKELPPEKKKEIFQIISELKKDARVLSKAQ